MPQQATAEAQMIFLQSCDSFGASFRIVGH